jgi:Domain of unknown function (DUF1996)
VTARARVAALAGAAALVLGAAACGGDSGTAAAVPDRPLPVHLTPTEAGPQGRVPQFVVQCGFSHAAADDPIVHPGHAGASHLHDFFGATTAAAGSTAADLAAGGTTCDQPHDRASYWAPALLDHGVPVTPIRSVAYYRPGVGVDPTSVRPYPFGLKMLGGDPKAAEPQPTADVAWSCGTGSVRTPVPGTCPDGRPLRLAVSFPDCWDGEHLDSADHRAHVARSRDGACPPTHPVPIPQLLFAISYPVTGPGHDLSLASGPVTGAHADFFNAWDQDKLATEVEACLHRGLVCGLASTRS